MTEWGKLKLKLSLSLAGKNKTAQLKWARCVFFLLSCFMKNMKLFLTCSVY